MKKQRWTRADDVFEFVCSYAEENNGATPSTRVIAEGLGFSQKRAAYLLTRLELTGKIEWIDRLKYKVVDSWWERPEAVQARMPEVAY